MKKRILIIIFFMLIASIFTINIGFALKIDLSIEINNSIIKSNLNKYDMIIITPKEFIGSLDRYIIHKNNHGILTLCVSLDEIYTGLYFDEEGQDNPEKIKYFIKNAIEEWEINYVLLIGSSKHVPVRFCYNNDNFSNYPEPYFVSELYYADIYNEEGGFSSWDFDNDGIFGEWDGEEAEDKNIDLKPDVCIGRLACQNKAEVQTVIEKIISYETTIADPSWFKKMVVAGGDTYRKFEGYEGEINNQKALDEMIGFTPVKLWASNGMLDKNGLSIIKELNKGCGFIYFSGHGNNNLWATYNSDSQMIGQFDRYKMKFLYNGDKLPVCIVGACHNSQFTVNKNKIVKLIRLINPTILKSEVNSCWSWELVKNNKGGSIATIGSTGLSWYSAEYNGAGTDWVNVQFFKQYNNGVKNIGEIWKNSISNFVDENPINWNESSGSADSIDAKTIQQWVLLGDPSLLIGGYANCIK